MYAPSLFMGAALGSAYGTALVPFALAGAPVAPPQAYALVGMAGVLAGVCKVPLTAILLLFELTHDSRIIVPLLGTVGVAAAVSGAAERKMDVMRSERGKVQNDPVGRVARRGTLPGVDDNDDCVARDTCTLDEDDGGRDRDLGSGDRARGVLEGRISDAVVRAEEQRPPDLRAVGALAEALDEEGLDRALELVAHGVERDVEQHKPDRRALGDDA